MKVRAEDFYKEAGFAFQEYGNEITDAVKKAVKAEARKCKKDIQERAPVRATNGGDYRDSWVASKVYDGPDGIRMSVHATKGQYRLTHLLENGHAKRGGAGRVDAIPHIGPAADAVNRDLPTKMKKAIGRVK